jgi:hypothetical protein
MSQTAMISRMRLRIVIAVAVVANLAALAAPAAASTLTHHASPMNDGTHGCLSTESACELLTTLAGAPIASAKNGEHIWLLGETSEGTYLATNTSLTTVGSPRIIDSITPSISGHETLVQTADSSGPAARVEVILSPSTIIGDGTSTTKAIAFVTDVKGSRVSGQDVAFTSSDGGEQIGPAAESASGTYTATITSSRIPGYPTVTATDNSISPSISGSAILSQEAETETSEEQPHPVHACLLSTSDSAECSRNFLLLGLLGGVTPRRLPAHEMAPVTLKITGQISTNNGSPPPALWKVAASFDKSGAIDAKGLPSCGMRQLNAKDFTPGRGVCGKSIIGTGQAHVEMNSSQQPISVPLTIFNGGVREGTTTLFIQAAIPRASPELVVATVKVSKSHQCGYGLQAVSTIPLIVNEGILLNFNLRIHRLFRYQGIQQSYALASCPNRKLNASVRATFGNGVVVSGELSRPCTPTG